MATLSCSRCGEPGKLVFGITHDKCGHYTHTVCAKDDIDFDWCSEACRLGEPITVPKGSAGGEPRLNDGVDYVKYPGQKQAKNKVLGLVTGLISKKPVTEVATPLELLNKRTPITQIMSKHGYGLDHMLRDGIIMNDFLKNGYSLEDVAIFEDVSKEGPDRALETLTSGLDLTANHLRDYPAKLSLSRLMELTGTKGDPVGLLHTHLGLEFPFEDQGLECFGDPNWNASHCTKLLGLSMDDLIDMGLQTVEQYQALMYGLTPQQAAKAEKALKCTSEHINSLVHLAAQAQKQEQAYAAKIQRQKAAAAKAQRRQQQQFLMEEAAEEFDEEEEEEYEEEQEAPKVGEKVAAPVMDMARRQRVYEERRQRFKGY